MAVDEAMTGRAVAAVRSASLDMTTVAAPDDGATVVGDAGAIVVVGSFRFRIALLATSSTTAAESVRS